MLRFSREGGEEIEREGPCGKVEVEILDLVTLVEEACED